jgi:hypothetical protein
VKGHYASQCPKRAQVVKGNMELRVEQEANMFVSIKESIVHNAVGLETSVARKEVLIVNQANIGIMHPSMLSDVTSTDS